MGVRRALLVGGLWVVGAWSPSLALSQQADKAPSVAEELASFRLADPSLTIELVVSEPLIQSPVAVAWDASGVMFVAEMRDYPDAHSGGSIKRLEDQNGDGVYERVTTFADGLPFPNGLLPYDGGLLVTAAPNLWFFRDADGDGQAEEKRAVLTGFAEGNQQLRANSPTWSWDNTITIANGRSGGAVRRPDQGPETAVSIARNDLGVFPDSWQCEAITGFSQFGLPRDDWGERFPSWNTVPFRHAVLELAQLERPGLRAVAIDPVAQILDATDSGRLFPIAPAPVTFNRESFAFFNASCGSTIYRGDALPKEYQGNALVCEPLTSLVHRRVLETNGPTFVAKRADGEQEFLASSHSWFRPVNLASGPDGALYVVDFCRALVEHPAFVPEAQRGGVDFRRGHEQGRLWRIKSRRTTDTTPAHPTKLQALTALALVDQLSHPNAWQRDTAQRLLVEHSDHEAIEALRVVARRGASPVGRAHAAGALLGILDPQHDRPQLHELVAHLLVDREPHLRNLGLRICESRFPATELSQHEAAILALGSDETAAVRFRSWLLLGAMQTPQRFGAAKLKQMTPGCAWDCNWLLAPIWWIFWIKL
jgi:putative membrane-bound dehydrogenase-like protein